MQYLYSEEKYIVMGRRYKTPKLVQTIERHNKIYRDYLILNQGLKLSVPDNWQDVTQTWKYQQLAEQHNMHYKSIQRIVVGKLREDGHKTVHI